MHTYYKGFIEAICKLFAYTYVRLSTGLKRSSAC